MNNKNLRLFLVLVGLILLAYLWEGPIADWRENRGRPDNFLSEVKAEELSKVEIKKPDEDVSIVKEDDRWKVEGTKDFYVKDSLAESMTENLAKASEDDLELISKDENKKEDFNLGEKAVKVKLYWGDGESKEFLIGKLGPDLDSTYISLPGEKESYLVDAKLYNTFYFSQWKDKTIFDSQEEEISKIRFQYPDREFSLEKAENGDWRAVGPYSGNFDQEKVLETVETMAFLQAEEIPEQTFEGTGLEKHLIIVEATGENLDNTIMIGEANQDGLYYAKRANSDNIYLISEEKKETLDKVLGDFR